jgi:predicted aspartyl protease
MNDVSLNILVDTGSAITIISESLVSKLGVKAVVHQKHSVVSASGDPLDV